MEPLLQLDDGRYALFEQVGYGHFGEVWKGLDTYQDTEVAVKLLRADVTLDEVLLESQLLTRFREHPRIVTIRNVEISPPRPFIVMDFLSGGSVQERLDEGRASLVESVRWIRHGLDALAHAHGLGVLHRDVKPGNLLLDSGDDAVLSDFGIAEDTIRSLLANDAVYVAHAAPELDDSGSTPLTDIWAMGCTLYRLITGEYPFEDAEDARSRNLIDPHKKNPQVPLSLTRVVRTALARNPQERYPDARRMLSDLTSCGIQNSWISETKEGTSESWRCDCNLGVYKLDVIPKRSGQIEVVLRLNRGRGFRRIHRSVVLRESDAARIRRNLLVGVIQGRSLRDLRRGG